MLTEQSNKTLYYSFTTNNNVIASWYFICNHAGIAKQTQNLYSNIFTRCYCVIQASNNNCLDQSYFLSNTSASNNDT